MSDEMVMALNEEQSKTVRNLSMSSSLHLQQLQKKILVVQKNKRDYLKFYGRVLAAKQQKTWKEDLPVKLGKRNR
jgi:hypothetical protein